MTVMAIDVEKVNKTKMEWRLESEKYAVLEMRNIWEIIVRNYGRKHLRWKTKGKRIRWKIEGEKTE